MAVSTPLGADALLLERLSGAEAVSELYEYTLDLLAEPGTPVAFDKLLGKPAVVALNRREQTARYLTGIISRFTQGAEVRTPRNDTFVRYRATLVPPLWLLTRRRQSRIFQHIDVPAILKQVLAGLEVRWSLRGEYEPRDYCVQYRESDFAFASRLMEEEGIFYFYDHTGGRHTLVVADHPGAHPPVPDRSDLLYDPVTGGTRTEDRITGWVKSQEVRTGQHTLWDHCFELPGNNLESVHPVQTAATVGTVSHVLTAGGADLEDYDYPGRYAQRFDGIDQGGGDRAADVAKTRPDGKRTVRLRAEAEAARGLRVDGESTCRQLTVGHTFALGRHFNADGEYMLTRVELVASLASEYGTASDDGAPVFTNKFTALPKGLPYRPPQSTPRPVVAGTQTATVVGPPGEEIFTDKYGRVKVQFPWDRAGKMDADSSCWVRVAQIHAGKKFGGIDIPRVGQEVVIAFEEGDPDRPIAIGRVYNAGAMPPFDLPGKRMVSGLKSNTYPGGGGDNEISLDDSKGAERMYIHAQYNQDEVVDHDQTSHVKNNRTKTVDVDETTKVGNNRDETVGVNHTEKIGDNRTLTVGTNQTETVGSNQTETIGANLTRTVGGMKNEVVALTSTETVGLAKATSVGAAYALTVGAAMNVAVGGAAFEEVGLTKKVIVGSKIEIVCGASRIVMEAGGKVTIEGTEFLFAASGGVKINGATIDLN